MARPKRQPVAWDLANKTRGKIGQNVMTKKAN